VLVSCPDPLARAKRFGEGLGTRLPGCVFGVWERDYGLTRECGALIRAARALM